MSVNMECHGLTDVGRTQERNEDQFLIADLNKSMRIHQTSVGHDDQTRLYGSSQGKLLIVADGMGGVDSGDRASTIMIDSITTYVLDPMRWFFQLGDRGKEDFRDDLKAAVAESNRQIRREIDANPRREGMKTTVTLAYLIWPQMHIVHLGDSRCYRLRQTQLEQVTRDQSGIEIDSAEPEASARSPWKDLLLDVVGRPDKGISPELYEISLQIGDVVLLCTDGLTKHVSDNEIAEVLDAPISAEQACQHLITLADRKGGTDNVTVIVAKFQDQEEANARAAHASISRKFSKEVGKPILKKERKWNS